MWPCRQASKVNSADLLSHPLRDLLHSGKTNKALIYPLRLRAAPLQMTEYGLSFLIESDDRTVRHFSSSGRGLVVLNPDRLWCRPVAGHFDVPRNHVFWALKPFEQITAAWAGTCRIGRAAADCVFQFLGSALVHPAPISKSHAFNLIFKRDACMSGIAAAQCEPVHTCHSPSELSSGRCLGRVDCVANQQNRMWRELSRIDRSVGRAARRHLKFA